MINCIICCYKYIDDCHRQKGDYFIYFYLTALISCLAFLLFYFYIYDSSSFIDIDFLEGIINDLEKTPIFDIILKEKWLEEIPDGYKSNVFAKYKGTNIGCQCGDDITEGSCTKEKENMNCDFIYKHKEEITKYRNKIFYVKREDLETFQKNLIIQKNGRCPKGKKPCGKLDSLENILCLKEDESCPINDIIINDKEKMDGYKSSELNEGKFIHFTNKSTNNFIISDLSVFFQEPCFYSQDYYWKKFLKVEKDEGSYGCKKSKGIIDKRYKYLNDKYNLSLLYSDNYLYYSWDIKSIIKKKKESFYNSEIKIFSRHYIGIEYKSLNNSKINNLEKLKEEFNSLKETKDEERKFYSRIANKVQEYIIAIFFSFTSFAFAIINVLLSLFENRFINVTLTKDILLYILVPELLLIIFVIFEFFQIKKPERSVDEIVNGLYYLVDENTKFGLDFIIKDRIDITSIRTYNYYALGVLFLLIFLIMIFVVILKSCCDKIKKIKNCENEKQNLLKEDDTEIKKKIELKDIV